MTPVEQALREALEWALDKMLFIDSSRETLPVALFCRRIPNMARRTDDGRIIPLVRPEVNDAYLDSLRKE